MELRFELERGEGNETAPRVWRLDEVPSDALLAHRFSTEWAAWYGPDLAGAAGRIGALLARRQPPAAGPAAGPADAAERAALPRGWVMPLVRRRRRQLAIWQVAAAEASPPGAGWLLEVQLYWGATSKPGVPPGSVVWQPCALRESPQCIRAAAAAAGEAELLLARQLRGGVGLLVLKPWRLRAPAQVG